MVELVVRGEHGGFPDLALLLLAVAHDAVDAPRVSVHAGAERHAAGDGEPLAERSRRDFDPGRVVLARVALEMSLELAEPEQVAERKVAALSHERVDHGRDVPDGEVPEVPGGVVEARGVDVHLVEEEHRAEVGGRERPAAVPRLGARQEGDDVPPDEQRPFAELVLVKVQTRHRGSPGEWSGANPTLPRAPHRSKGKAGAGAGCAGAAAPGTTARAPTR